MSNGKPTRDECEGCINHNFDPFRCKGCINGSHYEGEDDTEELTYAEFIDLIQEPA